MIHAAVITRWSQIVIAGEPNFMPALWLDVATGDNDKWADVTQQPSENIFPDPNLLVVEVVVSDATFDAIMAHPDYGAGAVLWSETA